MHRGRHLCGEPVARGRDPQPDDLDLAVERRVFDPVVEAAPFEGVVYVPRAVGREDHHRRRGRGDRADLRHRDREIREHLQQQGLELVVRSVDLVDKQHAGMGLQRRQQRPVEQETPRVQLPLQPADVDRAGQVTNRLRRPQVQQLAGEVPVVESLRRVEALVALQPQQRRAEQAGHGPGEGGLTDAGLPLAIQRLLQPKA